MKIVFAYYDDPDFGLTEYPEIIEDKKDYVLSGKTYQSRKTLSERKKDYGKYLVSGIMEDFQYVEVFEDFLKEMKDLEEGKIEILEWDGQAFQHKITRDSVEFTHTIFGECEKYNKWECSYNEYKKVLLGWKKFLKMPKSMKSKIEIEI